MKIAFLTRSLNRGGAERQLVALAKGLSARGHQVQVISFYGGGAFESDLQNSGVSLVCLEKTGRWDIAGFLIRLQRAILNDKPDLLHSYLTVPNILAVLMKTLCSKFEVVWGVRASDMDLSRYDWAARITYRIECFLSRYADLIISNSEAGRKYAISNGFREASMVVVPNGIDTDRFDLNPTARKDFRKSWGVSDDVTVIGIVARLDPMKGYELFLQAAKNLSGKREDICFVCVGSGKEDYSEMLHESSNRLGLSTRVRWLGAELDTSKVYNGFDVMTSTSIFGEGFSNTVGEAMSCGVPCVVTDTGDSALIVGDLGEVVYSRDPAEIASAWERCIALEKQAIRKDIRQRIIDRYSVENLVSRSEFRLMSLLEDKRQAKLRNLD